MGRMGGWEGYSAPFYEYSERVKNVKLINDQKAVNVTRVHSGKHRIIGFWQQLHVCMCAYICGGKSFPPQHTLKNIQSSHRSFVSNP